jgi:hypothetical protein
MVCWLLSSLQKRVTSGRFLDNVFSCGSTQHNFRTKMLCRPADLGGNIGLKRAGIYDCMKLSTFILKDIRIHCYTSIKLWK